MTEKNDDRDHAFLDALRDAAKEQDRQADALWQAVQAGDRSTFPEDGPDFEDLRPLEEDERADLTAALFGAAPAAEAAPVVDLAARRRRWLAGSGVGLALAAGIAALMLDRSSALPGYALELRAGEQQVRGEETVSHVYTEGSVLRAVLRPAAAASTPVDLAVVLLPEGGAARVVPLAVDRDPSGALRVTGVVGEDIDVGPGRHRLVFLIAPEGELPASPARAHAEAPRGGQRLQTDFRVSERE